MKTLGKRLLWWCVAGAALLGPALMLVKCALRPGGDTFPEVVMTKLEGNAVLITMDGIPAAQLHLYDPEQEVLPALDDLASRGVTVAKAFAAAAAPPAAPVSVITGLLPSTHGLISFDRKVHADLPSLGRTFAGAGYRSAAVANLPLLWHTGLGAGFEMSLEAQGAGIGDLAASAGRWIATRRGASFFLWIHFDPRAAAGGDPPERAALLFDRLVAATVAMLRAERCFESTLIVAAGSSSGRAADLEVPLIFRAPLLQANDERRTGPCSVLDVAPTLADLFRIKRSPAQKSPGRSLLEAPAGQEFVPLFDGYHFDGKALCEWIESGWSGPSTALGIFGPMYLLIEGPEPERTRIFNRLLDPDGKSDLSGTPKGYNAAQNLRRFLDELRSEIPPPFATTPAQLKPATAAFLERIGYGTRP
ncbi:MAG: sulfatase-like hydrolase/transferase [Planctomycetes bacterium]|nr:sulfatase-like hydrolase/transferase [Planctomycetota bacterium]